MDELLPVLLGLTCLLIAVTVIGHGLWVAFAAIFSDASASGKTQTTTHAAPCPRCGLPLTGVRCRACEWPLPEGAAQARPLEAMEAVAKQLRTLADAGVLDQATVARLLTTLAQERARLTPLAGVAPGAAPTAPADEGLVTVEMVGESPLVSAPPIEVAAPVRTPRDDREFVSDVPLAVRAAKFSDRQQQPESAIASSGPAEPRRTWTDWLAGFMEERNIRWGELVGGLLIVCGSIALVVSFWSQIAERPLLKFLIFNGVTAGLFGIGFYSHYRWRLHTTSQGLLVIGALLVPLNFLAIAAFSGTTSAGNALTIAGEIFSAVLFAALIYFATRILFGRGGGLFTVGVLAPSLAQLLVRRFVDPTTAQSTLVLLAGLPIACYVAVNGSLLGLVSRRDKIEEPDVNGLFKFLGVTTFAALLPLALLLFKTERPLETLRDLPLLGCLLGCVPLSIGLFLWRRLESGELTALRTAGTSVAVFGALVSLGGVVLAWPDPGAMLPAAFLEFVIFSFVAWQFNLPAAHLLAAACLAISYLLGVHVFEGRLLWFGQDAHALAQTLISGASGTLLPPLVLVYAGLSYAARRTGRASERAFLTATAALAILSVALVSWFGFARAGDPVGAAWVYLVYAAGCLALSARSPRAVIAWIGSAMLLAATVQAAVFRFGHHFSPGHGEVTALLTFCSLALAIVVLVRRTRLALRESPLDEVLWYAAMISSAVATAWLAWLAPHGSASFAAVGWAWLSLVWLAAALVSDWRPAWTWFQIGLCLTTVFSVAAVLEQYDWYADNPRRWLDPWTWEAMATALVGLNLLWVALRLGLRRAAAGAPGETLTVRAAQIVTSRYLLVDRVVTGALVALLAAIGAYAAMPGVLQELSPRGPGLARPAISQSADLTAAANESTATPERVVPRISDFAMVDIPHAHAAGWGAWLLLAALLVLLAAILRERFSPFWLQAGFIVAAVACPLWASRWEDEVAVASALRWFSAGLLIAGSIPLWMRDRLTRYAARLGWHAAKENEAVVRDTRTLVLLLSLLPNVAMAVAVGSGAIHRSSRFGEFWDHTLPWGILGALAVLASLGLLALPGRIGSARHDRLQATWPWAAASLALVLGAAPLLCVVLYHVGIGLRESPILGPDPASIFFRMGLAGSYAAPILLLAAGLVGHALRERSSGFALAGGLVLNTGATAAYLLAISKGGLVFDSAQWIRLAQLNASVAACFALAWIGLLLYSRRAKSDERAIAVDFLLATQVALAPALVGLALGWAWANLVQYPTGSSALLSVMNPELVDAWGWISTALAAVVVWAASRSAARQVSLAAVSIALAALATMAAAMVAPWDAGNWLAYNTLLIAHCVALGVLLLIAWRGAQRSESFDRQAAAAIEPARPAHWPNGLWVDLARAVIFVLAAREFSAGAWWTAGGFAVLAVTGASAAWIFRRRRYLYAAAFDFNVAGTVAWITSKLLAQGENFVYVNVCLLAAPVGVWVWIELARIRPRSFAARIGMPGVHRLASPLCLAVLALMTTAHLWSDARGFSHQTGYEWFQWAPLAITAIAILACLWDALAIEAVAQLYLWGLLAVGMLLDQLDLQPTWLLWTGNSVLAAYTLATSYLWSRRRGLAQWAQFLRMPSRDRHGLAGQSWLAPCNLMLVAVVMVLTTSIELTNHEASLRIGAAQAAIVQAVSVALLARGDRRGVLQSMALQLGAFGAVMFAWAFLRVDATLTLLNALVMLAAALAVVAVVYGFVLGKLLRENSDWLAPARRLTPTLIAISGGAILATLGCEIHEFSQSGEVQIAWPAIVAVAVTLGGLSVAALAAAILPGRDPLGLSARGRTAYVYGAEILLALLFVHIRLTMPWLFHGFFQQYWPLVVMAIAFGGVGFAELCRRWRQDVLAEPIENTGALLPVLPVLGFWATNTRVDYSLLLLSVGVLYAGLSIARRSFGFGLLAAITANGGLWYFLNKQNGWGFLAHPQIWLIPPAVCILVAAYLNRRRLSESQMTSIRYFTSMTVYLSSTADIFLNGVAQAPWLPLVLATLSILGILIGIVLRVRAFLFLGTAFLGLSLFTIIWHAAVDLEQTWIWYASLVVFGVLILALFAVFEKKRQNLLEMVERIKQWEP